MEKNISNKQIVEELKGGNPLGCKHLVMVYQNKLFDHLVRTFHLPREDAEEIVDDVLLAVVERIEMFSFRSSDLDFARWVFTILRNHVRDFLRREERTDIIFESYDESGLDDESNRITDEVVRAVVNDFLQSERGETENGEVRQNRPLEIVTSVLQSMESWERVLLRCRALNIPYEEIAHYVEKPANQLKTYHFRVRQKFMKLVETKCIDEGIIIPKKKECERIVIDADTRENEILINEEYHRSVYNGT